MNALIRLFFNVKMNKNGGKTYSLGIIPTVFLFGLALSIILNMSLSDAIACWLFYRLCEGEII